MTVDLIAIVGLANTALDVAQKTEMHAPFCLKPLAQAALQMADEIAKLRAALDNLRLHVEDAWDEYDEGGSYKTTAFQAAIDQADAVLDDLADKTPPQTLPQDVIDELLGFPPDSQAQKMPIVSGSGCETCGVFPGNPHWSNCAMGLEELADSKDGEL